MAKCIAVIESERLLLRGIEEADAETIVRWRSDPNVYIFFKSPHQITVEEHLNWFNNSYMSNDNRYDWMCIEKKTDNKIGIFGLYREGTKAEVNYLLAPEAQHKGFAVEAIKKLLSFAVAEWNCDAIVAEIHEKNLPSIRLAEKLGFLKKAYHYPFIIYETGAIFHE